MTERLLQDVALYRMDLLGHACPWDLKALTLLQEQQIPFQDHRLTSEAEVQSFKDHHKIATTPQIISNGQRIGG